MSDCCLCFAQNKVGAALKFDYAAYKAAFRQRAIERGIDPERGLTDYQARMLELKASGRWNVEGKGRLTFYTPSPLGAVKPIAVKRDEPLRYDADDLTPRGMAADSTVVLSDEFVTCDKYGAMEVYRQARDEWMREQRHNRPLKQVNADRRRFEDARAMQMRGLKESVS